MKITDAQLADLRKSFKLYDINGDGQIDRGELTAILKDLKIEDPGKEVDKIMAKLDSDGNGSISFGEFLSSLKTIQSLKEVEVDDIVAEYTSKPVAPDTKVEKEEQLSVPVAAAPVVATPAPAAPQEEQLSIPVSTPEPVAPAEEQISVPVAAPEPEASKEEQLSIPVAAPAPVAPQEEQISVPVAAPEPVAVQEPEKKELEPAPAPVVAPPKPVLYGSPHKFVWRYEGSIVHLAGDFTSWGTGKLPLARNHEGHFEIDITLTPGIYEYRFIIDNNFEWYFDILQPNVLNTGSGFINNFITV